MMMCNSEERLRAVLRRFRLRSAMRGEMPKPDDPWGAWVEYRLKRLEDVQTWEMRIIIGALLIQFVLRVLGIL